MRSRNGDQGFELEAMEPRRLLSYSFRADAETIAKAGTAPVTSTVVADFGGDGIADLAAAVGREVWILDGHADGSLGPARSVLRLGANAGILAAADLNGDGRIDLVAAQNNTGLGRAWIRTILNRTSGFAVDGVTRVAGRCVGVVVGNIDGDTRPDVLAVMEQQGIFFGLTTRRLAWLERSPGVLTNTGVDYVGQTDGPGSVFTGMFPYFGTPGLADLDGDGIQEVIAPFSARFSSVIPSYNTSVNLLSVASGAWVRQATIGFPGLVDAVTIVDTNGDGMPEAAFGVHGFVSTFPIAASVNRAYLADLAAGSISAPRLIMDRSGVTSQIGNTVDLRVIGQSDVNGDGRADLVVSTLFSDRAFAFQGVRQDLLAALVQRADGTFDEVRVRSTQTTVLTDPDRYFADRSGMVPYTLIPGGAGRTPSVVGLVCPPIIPFRQPESSSLVLLRTDALWKSPSVAWMSFRVLSPHPHPGQFVRVGDRVRLRIFAAEPERSRDAGIAIATLYRDSDGDGVWTRADEVLTTGFPFDVQEIPDNPFPRNAGTVFWALDFTVPPSWAGPAGTRTPQTLFVRVTDATGASSDPNAARPVVIVSP